MRVDRSEGASVVAVIETKDGEYVFAAFDEESISEYLYDKIGQKTNEINDVPIFIEASSWCPLASIGEVYMDEDFTIRIEEK